MTESIPTTWNEQRDAAFFGITGNLSADGFTARIDKVLEDLLVAESWESMALRSQGHQDLVAVPVRVTRRAG